MSEINISFNTSSIFNIPFEKLNKDFTFIVNEKRFKTSRVVADLLSPKIAQLHFDDSTLNEYSFQTTEKGDFQQILDLIVFQKDKILQENVYFLNEIFNILGIQSIQINDNYSPNSLESVFNEILCHEKYNIFYSNHLEKDIEFIAQNFYKIDDNHFENINNLKLETIEMIIIPIFI